ncbi:response regulator transcription factor [Streptomyces actuosus]|uniref:Response regulator transcription factor n=1 Tax=Streptomyces actuosus TaxID=1885 RepID=A0ABS2VZJ7_STRAS|nr:response regulator transcription factor [Streptomyces actuosus]MBN0048587.1 response regulator transcription factor [Streptomyces actuosus]
MITVVVADDEELVRESLRLILQTDDTITVVAAVADGEQVVAAARSHQPDVVLTDVQMPATDGITAALALRRLPRPPRVVVLTSFARDEYLYSALKAGVDGFLLKDTRPHELIDAIKVVARGEAIISPSMTRTLMEQFTVPHEAVRARERLESLPQDQRTILALLAQGLSNAEIGARMHLSESQVKVHVSRILRLLDCANRVQAAILAHTAGLTPPTVPS